MAHYVYIRAYGLDATTSDAGPFESEIPDLGTPFAITAIQSGGNVQVGWEYTYLLNDDLQGFRVYIGANPTPQWGESTDTGLTGGDGGNPTATYSVNIPNIWYGDVYVCVEARGAGTQTYSTVIPLMLPPKPVYDVQVDGVSDETLRWASDLRVTTRATQDPACDLRGVPIPTVTDIVAGDNVTVNVTGRTVEISVSVSAEPRAPNSISNLLAWYDATTLAGYANNDQIPSWPDISGNSYTLSQSTSARQPHYIASGINGLPVVYLDGVTRVGFTSTLTLSNPYSIFYVAQSQASTGYGRIIQGQSNNWLLGPYDGKWQWFSGSVFATTLGTVVIGRNIIHGVTQASGSGTHFLHDPAGGVSLFPVAPGLVASANTASPGATGVMRIGGEGAYDDYPNVYIGELVIYNRQLSYEEGAGLIMHLKDKWGV